MSKGGAAVLSLETAIPNHALLQKDSAALLEDNKDFQLLCERSQIQKRYFCVEKDELKDILTKEKSLNWRQRLARVHVPELALKASIKAIDAWNMPKLSITHLVFATSSGVFSPGADVLLLRLLELAEDVHRIMLYQLHGYGGIVALRMAKDIAENNQGARVLVVCSEMMEFSAQAPGVDAEGIMNCVTLGDGAAAAIVGNSEGLAPEESPLIELHQSFETMLPGKHLGVKASLDEYGVHYVFDEDILVIRDTLPNILKEMRSSRPQELSKLELSNLFWAIHPSRIDVLSTLEGSGLFERKLDASRAVLASYGDMLSASVLFLLKVFLNDTDKNKEWGIALGYGPGITVDALLVKKATSQPPQ